MNNLKYPIHIHQLSGIMPRNASSTSTKARANSKKKIPESVIDIELPKVKSINDLVLQLGAAGGFSSKKLASGTDILTTMLKDKSCFTFLSFPGNIIATGTRGVIVELVKRKLVDAVITTCGTLDHDLARIWKKYYHGEFLMNDTELHRQGINRLGNILVPNESYGIILEQKMQPVLAELWQDGKHEFSTKEIIWEFGRKLKDKKSILYWCAKNEIPVYVPGITDGAFGSQLWMFTQEHPDFKINLFKDEQELSDIVWTAKRTGALMIGGGISKHHTIWWNQYRNGLDYVVFITTAVEYDGSLSGAQVREGISWGKVQENAKQVTIEGDATVLLPVMLAAALERLK
jgi:deoxyhypusine synthase